jgi:hypothetical protein
MMVLDRKMYLGIQIGRMEYAKGRRVMAMMMMMDDGESRRSWLLLLL